MGRRKEHMSTYIRPDQLEALNRWSERLGKPKAVIVRAALDQHFRRLADDESAQRTAGT